jgi:predicted nucleotidyltransferase
MSADGRDQSEKQSGSEFWTSTRLQIDRQRLDECCRKHAIRRLAFFGSVLRDDFRPDSDVDVLVEFLPGRTPGFFRLFDMEDELSLILGRKADLRTREDLSPYFRDEVARTAQPFYDAA